jgi:hypothetical protein
VRLTAGLLAWLSICLGCSAARAAATVSIDQASILRVLRQNDVPGAKNLEPPSGALNASQFALSNNRTQAAARSESRALLHAGARSAAISEFSTPGGLLLKSTVVELGSDRGAAKLAPTIAKLSLASQPPPGAHTAVSGDPRIPNGSLLAFSPSQSGYAGGFELIASAHHNLYTLQGVSKPDRVSLAMLERLLRTIVSRG